MYRAKREDVLAMTSAARTLQLTSAFLLCMLAFAWPSLAESRSLHWSSLTVHLKIDEQGKLHISERHAMKKRSWRPLKVQRLATLAC